MAYREIPQDPDDGIDFLKEPPVLVSVIGGPICGNIIQFRSLGDVLMYLYLPSNISYRHAARLDDSVCDEPSIDVSGDEQSLIAKHYYVYNECYMELCEAFQLHTHVDE